MIVIGIDENGLGPILGPMVVTAAAFRCPEYNADSLWKLVDEQLPADDSKVVFKNRKHGQAETAVLRWLSLFNIHATNTGTLIQKICHEFILPCPSAIDSPQCQLPTPVSVPLFSSLDWPSLPLDVWNRFDVAEIKPALLHATNICPGLYNQYLADDKRNKLQLDFELMMKLISIIERQFPKDRILAICGKVGATRYYLPWFKKNEFNHVVALKEHPDCSQYQLSKRTTVCFIKDADSLHLPVAVASMIGKYIREIEMHHINTLLLPNQRPVSGYRDTRSKSFIQSTQSKRKKIGLPDRCFLRNS